jgi:predicted DNA-binding transcriptional regulator AlpA
MHSTRAATEPEPSFLPILYVFALLGISRNHGYRQVAAGNFPIEVIRIGDRLKCRSADVDAFIQGAQP